MILCDKRPKSNWPRIDFSLLVAVITITKLGLPYKLVISSKKRVKYNEWLSAKRKSEKLNAVMLIWRSLNMVTLLDWVFSKGFFHGLFPNSSKQ
jgi:hypothetical protein